MPIFTQIYLFFYRMIGFKSIFEGYKRLIYGLIEGKATLLSENYKKKQFKKELKKINLKSNRKNTLEYCP